MKEKPQTLLMFMYQRELYLTTSVCAFDGADLGKGLFVGDKIICPNCGSSFCIKNGHVEEGPSLRNIACVPFLLSDNGVIAVLPKNEAVPRFSKQKTPKPEPNAQTFVILGSTPEALAAIHTMNALFKGQMILLPTSGTWDNTFKGEEFIESDLIK